jgi:hypothetical protein
MADELARQGFASPFVGPEPVLPITLSWVKSEIDKEARVLHTMYWNDKRDHQNSKPRVEFVTDVKLFVCPVCMSLISRKFDR